MCRILALFVVAILLTGCDSEAAAKNRAAFEEQQRKQLKRDLEKVQSEINRNVQKSMKAGQNALDAAKPRVRR
jgi:hypothetical protein